MDNVIRIMCPKLTCRRILAVPTEARGQTVRCRGCGTTIKIPAKPPSAPAPADAAEAPGAPATAPAAKKPPQQDAA